MRSDGGRARTTWIGLAIFALVVAAGLWLVPRRAPVAERARTDPRAPLGGMVEPWPGSDDVRTVDDAAAFQKNVSGLAYRSAREGSPAVLWAVQNGPGTLYRLTSVAGQWVTATDERTGVRLRYPDGQGDVDAEGITLAATSDDGIYVASERNEQAKGSRNSVLRFSPVRAGGDLRASHEWNLTRDLPGSAPNMGLEAIAWVPDSALVAARFLDATTGAPYVPSRYSEHGTGLFFVGLEPAGKVYAFALNHVTMAFTRIAEFETGQAHVMALEYDRDAAELWATCDDTCGNASVTLAIDAAGRFVVRRRTAPPTTLPNANNEGFAIATRVECAGGRKPVFWADDGDTRGHSIRVASLPCAANGKTSGPD